MLKLKNVVAFGLAAAMTFGSVMSVSASYTDDSNVGVTGSNISAPVTGDNEDNNYGVTTGDAVGFKHEASGEATEEYVQKKVFQLVMPTKARMDDIFHYHADPMGLIAETNRLPLLTPDNGILFNRYDDDGNFIGVANESDALTIVNRSSSGVDLDYKVWAQPVSGAAVAWSGHMASATEYDAIANTFASGRTVYFGLKAKYGNEIALGEANTESEVTASKTGAILSAVDFFQTTLTGSAVTSARAQATSTSNIVKYEYKIPDEIVDAQLPSFTFSIVGALDKNVADTEWFQPNDEGIVSPLEATAMAMPDIKMVFIPKYVDAKKATVGTDTRSLYAFTLPSGTVITDPAQITHVKINGKSIADDKVVAGTGELAGLAIIASDDVLATLYDGTVGSTAEEKDAAWRSGIAIATVEWQTNGVTYFANLQ